MDLRVLRRRHTILSGAEVDSVWFALCAAAMHGPEQQCEAELPCDLIAIRCSIYPGLPHFLNAHGAPDPQRDDDAMIPNNRTIHSGNGEGSATAVHISSPQGLPNFIRFTPWKKYLR